MSRGKRQFRLRCRHCSAPISQPHAAHCPNLSHFGVKDAKTKEARNGR